MKPLDLEKLERDREGVTRDGKRVVDCNVDAKLFYTIYGSFEKDGSRIFWHIDGRHPETSKNDLFNKPDVEEEKPMHINVETTWKSSTLPPDKPSESCETFDWTVAMIYVGRGEKVQVKSGDIWIDITLDSEGQCFHANSEYRRKPSVPKPKYDRKTIVSDLLPTRLALLEARVENIHQALQGKGIL